MKARITPLQVIIHAYAWSVLARIVFEMTMGTFSINPIQELEQRTGRAAITLLVLTLSCTPLHSIFRWSGLLRHRRALGLYAFMYAALHVVIFISVDYGFVWRLIVDAVLKKPYIFVGAAAFLMLLPLFITSFDVWKIRLRRNWKRLHRLIYIIAPLVILHYAWSKKGDIFRLQGDIARPLMYGIIILTLLLFRIPFIRSALASLWTRILILFHKQNLPKTTNP